ncbi:UPF0303 protein [Spirochaetia bacterium]|nr:UPF0303 protein [Spirochaetia bacterium]
MAETTKYDKYLTIMQKQEALLEFSRFTRKDAWDLGHTIAAIIEEKKLVAALSIRLASGLIVFQYATEGTYPDNEYWMLRKFNLVRDCGKSSLYSTMEFKKKGDTLESRGMDPHRYVACGGAFPIRIKDADIIGAALVSGLPQLEDHDLLIEGISRHLGVKNVPRVPLNIKL